MKFFEEDYDGIESKKKALWKKIIAMVLLLIFLLGAGVGFVLGFILRGVLVW